MNGIIGFIDNLEILEKQIEIKKMAKRINHRINYKNKNYLNKFMALALSDNHLYYFKYNNYYIVGDGYFINYLLLKEELIKKGLKFNSLNQFEMVLKGYLEEGESFFKKLNGAFSFVIYDELLNKLIGVRDQFGIKPLYYYKGADTFIFGSEIKAFLEHKKFKKKLNKKALKPYLSFQYSVLNETFFKNVYKLKQGHYFIYENSNLIINKYFDFKFDIAKKPLNYFSNKLNKTMVDEINLLKQLTNLEGSFLSGGIDSSYLTKLTKPKITFTVGFNKKCFNEINQAKEFSKQLNIININKIVSPDQFFKVLEEVEYFFDEPSANLSAIPLYYLNKMASNHVQTVISGEGADELFGGYDTYNLTKYDLLYRKLPKTIRVISGYIVKNAPHFKGKNFLIRNGLNLEHHFIGQAYIFKEKELKKILNKSYQDSKSIKEIIRPVYLQVQHLPEIYQKQYLDFHFWLPNDIILKADKMASPHSLNIIMPFLSLNVYDIAKSIPFNYKKGTSKLVLREAAYKYLPRPNYMRPKLGFPVPFSNWIKEEKYYIIVKKMFSKKFVLKFFNQKKILNLLENHYLNKSNNGRKIWTIYVFLIWYEVYFIKNKTF